MKKRIRILVAVAATVLLMSGVLIYFALNPKKDSDTLADQSYADEGILLWEYTEEQFEKIHVENAGDSFDIVPSTDGEFEIRELEQIPRNSLSYHSVSSLEYFEASGLVDENPENLSIFGLDNPTATLEISFSDGTSKTLLVGAPAPSIATVYIKLLDSPEVYIADEAYIILATKTKKDFISLNVTGVSDDPANIDVKKIVYSGQNREEDIVVESSAEVNETIGVSTGLVITSPFVQDVHGDMVQTIDQGAVILKASGVEEIFPSEEFLEECGFTNSPYTMYVEYVHMKTAQNENKILYENGDYKILVGSSIENSDDYYVMREGIPVVYRVEAQNIPWISFTAAEISSNIQFMSPIEEVASVNVKTTEKEYEFQIQMQDFDDGRISDNDGIVTTENGKELDGEQFRNLYHLLMRGFGEQLLSDVPQNDVPLEVTYSFVDRLRENVIVQFVPVDEGTCAISVNGLELYTVRSSYVIAVMTACENIVNEKEVDPNWD